MRITGLRMGQAALNQANRLPSLTLKRARRMQEIAASDTEMARSTRRNGLDQTAEAAQDADIREIATILSGVVKAVDEHKTEFKQYVREQLEESRRQVAAKEADRKEQERERKDARREMRKWAMGILATIIGAIILRYFKLG